MNSLANVRMMTIAASQAVNVSMSTPFVHLFGLLHVVKDIAGQVRIKEAPKTEYARHIIHNNGSNTSAIQ